MLAGSDKSQFGPDSSYLLAADSHRSPAGAVRAVQNIIWRHPSIEMACIPLRRYGNDPYESPYIHLYIGIILRAIFAPYLEIGKACLKCFVAVIHMTAGRKLKIFYLVRVIQ